VSGGNEKFIKEKKALDISEKCCNFAPANKKNTK
jgi:hypothetical protein